MLYSFNEANTPTHITQFSFKWYNQLFSDSVVLGAFKNSLILGIVSSFVSMVLGALLGYGMYAHKNRRLGWLVWIIYLPIVTPDIIYGIAQLSFFTNLHNMLGILSPGLGTMMIAHISFQVPFVALLVYSRLVGLDPRLFDACHDLYANGLQRARFFIVPTLRPALLAGFFLAFTLSIDDFVISFFTAGPNSTTLPIYIWSAIKKGITPEVNAAATILIGAVFAVAAISMAFQYIKNISTKSS
jgi:spermidine/putrescine transport system permease protein